MDNRSILLEKLRKHLMADVRDDRAEELQSSMRRTFINNDISSSPWDLSRPGAEVGHQNYELSQQYRHLLLMSQALISPKSKFYQNTAMAQDITSAMEWLLNNTFRGRVNHPEGKAALAKYYGTEHQHISEPGCDHSANWWHYDIGMPLLTGQILALIGHDYLPKDLMGDYLKRIHIYTPNSTARVFNTFPNYGAANMAEKCVMIMIHGILTGDESRIRQAATELLTPLTVPQASAGNNTGYHWDGSYIEHEVHPYALGYGIVALKSISEVMGILGGETLNGKPVEFDKTQLEILLGMIEKTWLIATWRGAPMHNLMGRSVSRNRQGDRISDEVAKVVSSIINDIPAEPTGLFAQNNQSRTYLRKDDFAFSVSTNNFLAGIAPVKIGNGENLKGQLMGEGMTYLYLKNDPNQYDGSFFATVDYDRLPGITAEHNGIISGSLDNCEPNPLHTWAGTCVLGNIGATGFKMNMGGRLGLTVTANKSWFYCGSGAIICLGSNINGTNGREVYTVIENRRIPGDGIVQRQGDYAYISYSGTNGEPAQISYFIPSGQDVAAYKTEDSGRWSDVNVNGSTELLVDTYAQLVLNHGVNPKNATYEYAILPNAPEHPVIPDYKVLCNTPEMHAIYDPTSRAIMVNNFADNSAEITSPHTGIAYMIDKAVSVIIQEHNDTGAIDIAILDPTTGDNSITVAVIGRGYKKIGGDDNVSITRYVGSTAVCVIDPLYLGKRYNTWKINLGAKE